MTANSARPVIEASEACMRPDVWSKTAVVVLIGFLLIFPKGGIKLAGVPLTWGYLALAAAMLPFMLDLVARRSYAIARIRLWPVALLVPLQLVIVLELMLNGSNNLGFTVSLLVTFFFLPAAFVVVIGSYLDRTDLAYVLGWIRTGVFAVAVYGIFLFFFKLQTGKFIEIPLLTVNAGDVGGLEDKSIDRGGVFKLISTYNNGNIYGVSMLTLLPLYAFLERSTFRLAVVKLSLVLTLSRTVWVGLIAYEVLQRLYVRRPTLRRLLALATVLVLVSLGVWYALNLMGAGPAFLLDRSLGGRIGQWRYIETASLLSRLPFDGIGEIVYLSVLHSFGLLGLACFLVAMLAPLLLHFARAIAFAGTAYKRSLAAGLLTYLVVAGSDGALLYIPVMAMYWFVVSLLLSDNIPVPSGALEAAQSAPRRSTAV